MSLISSVPGKALGRLLNREVCRVIQHAFSKQIPVHLITKDANLVFCLSVYKLFTLQTSDYDVIIEFSVDSMSLTTSFKKGNVMVT